MDSLIAPNSLSVFELLVRVTILLSAALALAWLARKRPARIRHLLWTLTFALLLALPGLSLLGPSWEVPIIPSIGSAPQEAPPVDGAANGFIPLPEPVPALPDAGSTPVPVQESVPPTRSIPLPLLLWGVGCAAVLASLVMGGVRFAGLGRAATPLDDPIRLRQVEAVRQQLGIRGDVRVVLSRRAATPMTGGLRRPVVLLPMSATLWTPERWTVVLTHEMIHLCRRDVLRQLMVRAGLALYWFHPLSWVAARLAATASEEACDEEVLALGTRPSQYATHLFSLAGDMSAHRPVLSLAMGQHSHSQLERRIVAILKPSRPRRSILGTALMVMAIGSVGVSVTIAHPVQIVQSAHLSPTPLFDSGEHPATVVSELGVLSRGMVLNEERVVLLDGRTLLFINPRTGELWTAGGQGGGPGEFAGSGLELGLFREPDALTVWDLNNGFRLTTFSHTGDVLGTRRFDVSSAEFDHMVSVARLYGVFTDGSLAFIDGFPRITDQPSAADRLREYVAEVGGDGDKRTIVEFLGAESSDVLFGHRTLVSIGNDRVAVADTESTEVMILDQSGALVSRIPMPGERLRVSEDHLAARLGEAGERARRSHERTVEQLEAMGRSTEGQKFEGRDYRHNEIAPPIDRMRFDGDGRLWMRHYVMPGADTKSWTVWDGGSTTFSVDMPASESFLDVRGSLVLLRIRSELGVDRAVIRELVFR